MLDRLIQAVRAGESRALVVRGEPGVGKTALLDYLVDAAQWLDHASAQVLGFVARRLVAESVGLVSGPRSGHFARSKSGHHRATITLEGDANGAPQAVVEVDGY